MPNYVKFSRGSLDAYSKLTTKNSDTLYFIEDPLTSRYTLYLGEQLIVSDAADLADINDIAFNYLADKDVLVYNAESELWVNKPVLDLIANFTGATAEAQGSAGLVPAPGVGQEGYFLRGDGTWAEVKTSSTAKVYQTTVVDEETQEEAITRIVGDNTLQSGDIAIIKVLIADNKYEYTAYVYNGENWAAMDGNYSAENVYFTNDFTFTTKIGTVQTLTNGSATVEAKGKNVQSFLASLFAKEEYPTTPSVTASLSGTNVGAKEVGSNVTVGYSFTTSAGNYAYGPANGVEFSDFEATFNGETKTSKSGTFTAVQVTDDTNLKVTGSCKSSDGAIPVTNLGNNYPTAQIKAKEFTNLSSGALTGYRAWFYGYKNGDNAVEIDNLNSSIIRGLSSANGKWTSQMSVAQMKQMFFAAPAGKGSKPSVQDHSTTAPQTIKGPVTVSVEGANGYDAIDYDVWYVDNADAASGSATLDITW